MFSVVIPLFNKEPYIQRALDSVYQQSLRPAEIIVVNDGSNDRGADIARSQRQQLVRVVDQPNRGGSAARNIGLRIASNRWVAFLDADDRWKPDHLMEMAKLISRFPTGVLYGGGFVAMRSGVVAGTYSFDKYSTVGRPVDFFDVWRGRHVLHMSTTVADRCVAESVGGFPEGEGHLQDFVFWTRMALSGMTVLSPKIHAEYDVAVPGQSVEYWSGDYKKNFDILVFHQLLATEMHRALLNHGGLKSFPRFAAYHLRLGLFQRLIAGNIKAARLFDVELNLKCLPLGMRVNCARRLLSTCAGRTVLVCSACLGRRVRSLLKHNNP